MDNRITLHKLEVFTLVAKLGSVSRAAEQLYVAQPVVTAHLRSLEERVGAKLISRENNRMRLTEAGQRVHEWAQETLRRSHEVGREVTELLEGSRGQVIITSSMTTGSYILPEILAEFRTEHPGASLTLDVSNPEGAFEAARAGDADLAVLATDDRLSLKGMTVEWLRDEPLILVAAPSGVPEEDEITPSEIEALPFVCAPHGYARRAMVDRALAKKSLERRNVVLELGHPEGMKAVAARGIAAGFVFQSAARRELAEGVLREVKVRGANFRVPIALAYRKKKRFTPLQTALVDHIRSRLGD